MDLDGMLRFVRKVEADIARLDAEAKMLEERNRGSEGAKLIRDRIDDHKRDLRSALRYKETLALLRSAVKEYGIKPEMLTGPEPKL